MRRHNLLLIVKEALHNIVKHANAREVRVRLSVEENRFQMTLEDDGIGLSEDVGGKGNGMKNMRSRAQSLGGELALSACASGGLKITVTVSNMEKSFK